MQPGEKDINFPALPWEVDRTVAAPEEFNSPGDYLQQVTNFLFQVTATRVIFSHINNVRAHFWVHEGVAALTDRRKQHV